MSEKDKHKATYYSGKKPYLTHNYRTMMKKKTQEEYYFHELHEDPMSELLKPYLNDPELPGFTGYEYMGPIWWEWPPFDYPGAGTGGGVGPYDDDDGLPDQKHCDSCVIVGPESVSCGEPWVGQVIPSQCAGFITFAVGLDDSEEFPTAVTDAGVIVVTPPSTTTETSMLVCSSGGQGGVTCCLEVIVDCCCLDFTLTGDDTVNPSATWTGTIDPACPGATCEVTSNSGCTLSCAVNEEGTQVTVTPGAEDCGSFTVTVNGLCDESASFGVRINNVGQSAEHRGTWQTVASCTQGDFAADCELCRSSVVVNYNCKPSGQYYKWAWSQWCCYTNKAGLPCESDCLDEECPAKDCSPPACCTTCTCTGSCICDSLVYLSWTQTEWKCDCTA